MNFSYLKIIHVLSFVLWFGPAIGAYWIVFRLEKKLSDKNRLLLEKFYEQVLIFEHVALIALLGSGLGMLSIWGFESIHEPWIKTKLYLVGGICLIEVLDITVSHLMYRKLARKNHTDINSCWQRFFDLRMKFYYVVVPILFLLVLGIVYLAIAKETMALPI
jgi:hypothetical protein